MEVTQAVRHRRVISPQHRTALLPGTPRTAPVMHCCTTVPAVPHSADQRWQPACEAASLQMLPSTLKGWQ